MLRKTYRVQSVRSVRTLPAHLYHRRDFERRKRAMHYIKEEYDYISSIRRNNILFDIRGAFAPHNYLPSAVSFFPSLSFTSAPFSASGMGRPIRPAFSSMESPSLAM